MAGQAGFEHIKVARADDDVVIVAGAVPQTPEQPSAPTAQARPAADEAAHASDGAASADVDSEGERTAADAAYVGTTLEDIQGSRMPTAQKAVIALAVAAVAAFVIWYVVVML